MRELLNSGTVAKVLEGERFARGHGADGDYQGAGLLYATLPYLKRARVCVCLGTGSGYVAKWMSLGQQAAEALPRRTIIVDANTEGADGGKPDYFVDPGEDGDPGPLRRNFPEIEIVEGTWEALFEVLPRGENDPRIDYLHIDADHRWEYVSSDFWAVQPWLHRGSVVTLHDSKHSSFGVRYLVRLIRELPGHFELMDWPIRNGVAVVRVIKEVAG